MPIPEGLPNVNSLERTRPATGRAGTPSAPQTTTCETVHMTLKLYFHPLSSFCRKALIALYENDTPFEPRIVDLVDATSAADVPQASGRSASFRCCATRRSDRTVPEATHHHRVSGAALSGHGRELVPADADLARQTRLRDRFYDLYVHVPMQKIVDRQAAPCRASDDPHGVEAAKALLTPPRHDRTGDGGQDLGHGRRLHHGRLRRRAGAVLRQQGGALRGRPRNVAEYLDA